MDRNKSSIYPYNTRWTETTVYTAFSEKNDVSSHLLQATWFKHISEDLVHADCQPCPAHLLLEHWGVRMIVCFGILMIHLAGNHRLELTHLLNSHTSFASNLAWHQFPDGHADTSVLRGQSAWCSRTGDRSPPLAQTHYREGNCCLCSCRDWRAGWWSFFFFFCTAALSPSPKGVIIQNQREGRRTPTCVSYSSP